MLHERCLELIHAEIDGTLNPQERAELNRYLLADPGVRRQREELRNACKLLDALEPLDPPRDYVDTLFVHTASRAAPSVAPLARTFWNQPVMRYAAAFGAGIALTVVALGTQPPAGSSHDMRALAGTLSAQPAPGTGATQIEVGTLRGVVQLQSGGEGRTVLDIRMQAGGPVDIVAEYNGRTLRLGHDGQPGSQLGLALGESVDSVRVRFLVGGTEVYQAVLHNPG